MSQKPQIKIRFRHFLRKYDSNESNLPEVVDVDETSTTTREQGEISKRFCSFSSSLLYHTIARASNRETSEQNAFSAKIAATERP